MCVSDWVRSTFAIVRTLRYYHRTGIQSDTYLKPSTTKRDAVALLAAQAVSDGVNEKKLKIANCAFEIRWHGNHMKANGDVQSVKASW